MALETFEILGDDNIDADRARGVVRRRLGQLLPCFGPALWKDASLEETLQVRAAIGTGGRVAPREIRGGGAELETLRRCTASVVERWRLHTRPGTGPAELVATLRFWGR